MPVPTLSNDSSNVGDIIRSLTPIFGGSGTGTSTTTTGVTEPFQQLLAALSKNLTGNFSKQAAIDDSQGQIRDISKTALEAELPSITSGTKGQDIYNSTTQNLLTNDLQARIQAKGASVVQQNIKNYADITAQNASAGANLAKTGGGTSTTTQITAPIIGGSVSNNLRTLLGAIAAGQVTGKGLSSLLGSGSSLAGKGVNWLDKFLNTPSSPTGAGGISDATISDWTRGAQDPNLSWDGGTIGNSPTNSIPIPADAGTTPDLSSLFSGGTAPATDSFGNTLSGFSDASATTGATSDITSGVAGAGTEVGATAEAGGLFGSASGASTASAGASGLSAASYTVPVLGWLAAAYAGFSAFDQASYTPKEKYISDAINTAGGIQAWTAQQEAIIPKIQSYTNNPQGLLNDALAWYNKDPGTNSGVGGLTQFGQKGLTPGQYDPMLNNGIVSNYLKSTGAALQVDGGGVWTEYHKFNPALADWSQRSSSAAAGVLSSFNSFNQTAIASRPTNIFGQFAAASATATPTSVPTAPSSTRLFGIPSASVAAPAAPAITDIQRMFGTPINRFAVGG